MTDSQMMERALAHAARGIGRTTPNPPVGAVVVSPEGVVVGTGYHERAGEPHAEVRALRAAGSHARGSTLYCTLEPCCHQGRTPPCVDAIVAAGVGRVVAATIDPDPRVAGRGIQFLRSRGVIVEVGVGAEQARLLILPFSTAVRTGRPLVALKAATSLDGCLARGAATRTKLTSPAADRLTHRLRAEYDAIAVGSGTILVDNPLLTARHVYRARPLVRAIFDRRLRTPPDARVLTTLADGPVMILTSAERLDTPAARALADAGATVRAFRPDDIASGFRALRELDVTSVLLEGGAALHAAAWDGGIVDAVTLIVTPHWIGPDGVRFLAARRFSVADLHHVEVAPCGPDVVISGYVHRPH